jgi:hypothetical protein
MLLNVLKTIVLGAIATILFFYASEYYLALSEPKSMIKNVLVYGSQIAFPLIYLSVALAFLVFKLFCKQQVQR